MKINVTFLPICQKIEYNGENFQNISAEISESGDIEIAYRSIKGKQSC